MLFIPNANTTLAALLDHYIATVSIHKKSYESEIYRIRPIKAALGEIAIGDVSSPMVVAYRDMRLASHCRQTSDKFLSGATVKLELMLLSNVFTVAISEWGLNFLPNPVSAVRKPKVSAGRSRRITNYEEKIILSAAAKYSNSEFYPIIVLALETAMRQGEILSLTWNNINWTKRTAFLPTTKNGDAREVPLSRAAYAVLKSVLTPKPHGKIFTYTSAGIKSTWRAFVQNLGITDLHFHDLRHSAISSLVERGLSTLEVAAISGHKSLSMLKKYSHLHAYKLVAKLDPKPRAKKERILLREQLQAYPAMVTVAIDSCSIVFLDIPSIHILGTSLIDAVKQATTTLLAHLVQLLCEGRDVPIPSAIEEFQKINTFRVLMISPL